MRPIVGLTLNYRDAERTSRCIGSLLDDGALAVFVWDNSADDGMSAQALRARWQNEPRVIIEESAANLGFAAGVNRGMDMILGRWPTAWIMLINNDACVFPGALQTLAAALETQPQAVVAYPRIDHGGQISGTIFYQRHFALLSFDKPWPGSFPYPSGCALLIAPERVELPLYDEDFFMYGEDVLLGWRLGPARLAHVPQVIVWHEGSASSRNGSTFYERHLVAGHLRLAKKLARTGTEAFILLGCRIMSLSLRGLWRSVHFRSFIPLRALGEGWLLVFSSSVSASHDSARNNRHGAETHHDPSKT